MRDAMDREAINKARIVYYGFFSAVFAFNLTRDTLSRAQEALDILSRDPVDEATERSLKEMRHFLRRGGYEALKDESDAVFFSPATAYIPMTASYYSEKRDDGAKRLEMMEYVFQSKYRKDSDAFKENEDHLEFILLFMQQLIIDETVGDPTTADLAFNVFAKILNEMIDGFVFNLFNHVKSRFYRQTAVVLYSFMEIERLFLGVEAPQGRRLEDNYRFNKGKGQKSSRRIVQRNPDGYGCI
jgi:TorA maturation chaperone TorD